MHGLLVRGRRGASCAAASSSRSYQRSILRRRRLTSHGIREAISYQPASRYRAFQATETAIYLALALALSGYCFRRLNRRLS